MVRGPGLDVDQESAQGLVSARGLAGTPGRPAALVPPPRLRRTR